MLEELKQFCEQNNGNILIYGAGLYGRRIGVWLDEHGYTWQGFIETRKTKDMVMGKPVYELVECDKRLNYGFVICVNPGYKDEIVDTLEQFGTNNFIVVNREQVTEADNENKYVHEYDLNSNIIVLLYHRVINLKSDPQLLSVDVDRFDKQMCFLKDNYRILRMEDDWFDVNEKSVVITFDDGYEDNYLYALPILEKYEIPATVFVATENIDTDNEMWWDELEALFLLNTNLPEHIEVFGENFDLSDKDRLWQSYCDIHKLLKSIEPEKRREELKRLERILKSSIYPRQDYRMLKTEEVRMLAQSEVITIGGHTVTHSSLANESIEKQKWEINQSKEKLESIIEKPIDIFSYPFGGSNDYTDITCNIVKDAGYKKAAIVKEGTVPSSMDIYRIPRNLIRNWDIADFERAINRVWCLFG